MARYRMAESRVLFPINIVCCSKYGNICYDIPICVVVVVIHFIVKCNNTPYFYYVPFTELDAYIINISKTFFGT